jgi:hypothetical protein
MQTICQALLRSSRVKFCLLCKTGVLIGAQHNYEYYRPSVQFTGENWICVAHEGRFYFYCLIKGKNTPVCNI